LSLIHVENLTKVYGYLPVLKKISLDIERGQFVALLGANGSGKSTLLRLLAGLTPPSNGTITIGGWQIPQEIAQVRPQIGMVSHKSLLYHTLTAYENLAFFADLYNIPRQEQATHLITLLERVGLKKRAHSLVRTFSRGMQQRLSIARALLHNPHVLLFDEPYTGLDQEASAILDELLRQAHADDHTIVMTTHDLNRTVTLAQRYVILHKGQIVEDAPLQDMSGYELSTRFQTLTGEASAR
jgi:heme exporter protein A